jgi:hypothetical protein
MWLTLLALLLAIVPGAYGTSKTFCRNHCGEEIYACTTATVASDCAGKQGKAARRCLKKQKRKCISQLVTLCKNTGGLCVQPGATTTTTPTGGATTTSTVPEGVTTTTLPSVTIKGDPTGAWTFTGTLQNDTCAAMAEAATLFPTIGGTTPAPATLTLPFNISYVPYEQRTQCHDSSTACCTGTPQDYTRCCSAALVGTVGPAATPVGVASEDCHAAGTEIGTIAGFSVESDAACVQVDATTRCCARWDVTVSKPYDCTATGTILHCTITGDYPDGLAEVSLFADCQRAGGGSGSRFGCSSRWDGHAERVSP